MTGGARIAIADEQRALRLPLGRVRRLAEAVMAGEGLAGTLSIAFVGNRRMRSINRRFLKHDFATDVLSFPLGEGDGELVISTEYAVGEARTRRIPVEEELLRYVAHGILHLAGYDDHAPAARKRMWARQEEYLSREMTRR